MHASMAFLNGAGAQRHGTGQENAEQLELLNTLLTGAGNEFGSGERASQDQGSPSRDRSQSKDEHKAGKERREPTLSEPGGFKNQPDDPTNPNEARERVRRKLTP